jgi:hypothetical protein
VASLTSITFDEELIFPESDEQEVLEALSKLLGDDTASPLRLVAKDGSEIELPGSARDALLHVVAGLSKQRVVSVQPVNPLLTVAQVRAMLGATMTYVESILESGELPSTVVNSIRRIDLRDAWEFRRAMKQREEEGLIELVRLSEEMGLYDLEIVE